jgi:hypothetical protein
MRPEEAMMSGLGPRQIAEFERAGFLAVRGLLDPVEDLAPITAEYSTVLDRLARDLFERHEIAGLYSDLGFSERFMTIVAETGAAHSQYFDLSLPQSGISSGTPIWNGPAVFSLLTNPTLLDAVESLIGGEIYSNPVQHVRIKPPEAVVSRELAADQHALNATSWHQDNGVITPDADDSEILTVWIPLSRASVQHGCLQVIPGSHRSDVMLHCPGGPAGLEIPEKVLSRNGAVAVPLEPGDVLLLHRRTAHASLPNTSEEIRWSLDLRYNPIGHATGRSAFPGFVARSRRDTDQVLADSAEWSRMWSNTRDRLAVDRPDAFNRWDGDAPACA